MTFCVLLLLLGLCANVWADVLQEGLEEPFTRTFSTVGRVVGIWGIRFESAGAVADGLPDGLFLQPSAVRSGLAPVLYYWLCEHLHVNIPVLDWFKFELHEVARLVPNVGLTESGSGVHNHFILPSSLTSNGTTAGLGSWPYGYRFDLVDYERDSACGEKFTVWNGKRGADLFRTTATHGGPVSRLSRPLRHLWTLRSQAWIGSIAGTYVCAQMRARPTLMDAADVTFINSGLPGPTGEFVMDDAVWIDMNVEFDLPGTRCSQFRYATPTEFCVSKTDAVDGEIANTASTSHPSQCYPL